MDKTEGRRGGCWPRSKEGCHRRGHKRQSDEEYRTFAGDHAIADNRAVYTFADN